MFAESFSILRLALLALKWIIFHRFVLLWRREYCGYIVTEPFSSLVLGVQWQNSPPFPALLWCCQLNENGIIAPCTSWVSVFWGEFMFSYSLALRALWWILQQCIFLLWHWKSSARNHCRSLHFAGVRLFSNQFNSVGLFVRNQLAGLKMNAWVTRQTAGEMKKYRGEIELLALFSGGCFTTAIRIAK